MNRIVKLAKSVIFKKPAFTIFRVTSRCNLSCRMCSIWRHGDKRHELSLDKIQELARILDKMNVSIVALGGGEPLMREDLPEIVKIFSKKFTVRMQTNAMLASEDKIKRLVKAGLRGVSISLDTLNPDKQDYICNAKNSWYKTVENMVLFAKIMPKRGSLLLANAVVSKLNIRCLPDLAVFMNRLGYSATFLPVILAEKEAHGYTFRDFAPEMSFANEDHGLIDSIYAELIRMKKQGSDITNSFSYLRESAVFLKKNFRWKCDAAKLYFHIGSDGKFLPCTELESGYSIFDPGFIKHFNSADFKRGMVKKITSCPGCLQPCQVEVSKIMHDPIVFLEKAKACLKLGLKKRKNLNYEEAIRYADCNA